jgi:thiosulfate/3-mercaptopyruvate sulfurtransferase
MEERVSRSEVLVDTAWALAHASDPTVVLVEVDEDVSAYDTGHLAGAVRLDWRAELQQAEGRDVIDQTAFSELMSAKGIRNDDTVVLYGGNNNWFAAYAYWYFKLYGHRDVRLLDGGRKKWELEGQPMVADATARPATTYEAQPQDLTIRAFRDDVVAAIGSTNLVDVRSPDEFAGRLAAPAHLPQEQAQRNGHVPTAINIPWSKAANDDGTFKTDDELRALYAEAGLDDGRDTIVYCRIGERSSHSWFVLRELLGNTTAKNYDGSWVEYGSLIGVPVTNPTAGR